MDKKLIKASLVFSFVSGIFTAFLVYLFVLGAFPIDRIPIYFTTDYAKNFSFMAYVFGVAYFLIFQFAIINDLKETKVKGD